MGCGCGKNRLAQKMGKFVDLPTDPFGLIRLQADGGGEGPCEAYHGVFDGTYLHIVGAWTEHERIFIRQNRREAIDYAKSNGDLPVSNLVLARSLCHDTVVAVLGA